MLSILESRPHVALPIRAISFSLLNRYHPFITPQVWTCPPEPQSIPGFAAWPTLPQQSDWIRFLRLKYEVMHRLCALMYLQAGPCGTDSRPKSTPEGPADYNVEQYH